jgi:hypothetical protein
VAAVDEEGSRVFGVLPDARAGPARYAGPHGPPAGAGLSADLRQEGPADALGQAIVTRLFSAGLRLHSALALTGDGPVAQRLSADVADIDEAIIDLRISCSPCWDHLRGRT